MHRSIRSWRGLNRKYSSLTRRRWVPGSGMFGLSLSCLRIHQPKCHWYSETEERFVGIARDPTGWAAICSWFITACIHLCPSLWMVTWLLTRRLRATTSWLQMSNKIGENIVPWSSSNLCDFTQWIRLWVHMLCLLVSEYLALAQRLLWVASLSSVGFGPDLPLPRSRWGRCDHRDKPCAGVHCSPFLHSEPISRECSSCSTPGDSKTTAQPISHCPCTLTLAILREQEWREQLKRLS